MNYLVFDTSGTHLTVALKVNGKLHKIYKENCGMQHSTTLMPAIENLLLQAKITVSQLDFIAVCVGAGSFTGIRIGISTAKALCYASGVKCLAVTSFDALAYDKEYGDLIAVIDAKHGSYYVQEFEKFMPKDAMFVSKNQLEIMSKNKKIVCFTDIDLEHEKGDICNGIINAVEKKQGQATNNLESLTPLYIRKSQAEENR